MAGHPDLIDRTDLVLLVIDVQDRLADAMERRDAVIGAVVCLIRAAAIVGAPIVVTRQYPKGLGDTVAEVSQALAEATDFVPVTVVDKMSFDACDEPAFMTALEAGGRRQFVVVGMETHICVAQTALGLSVPGHRVQVVEDACCSRHASDHATAIERLRAQGVTVTAAEAVMYEAVGCAGTDDFRRLLAVVKQG